MKAGRFARISTIAERGLARAPAPLRVGREDIVPLAAYYLRLTARVMEKDVQAIAPEGLQTLLGHLGQATCGSS